MRHARWLYILIALVGSCSEKKDAKSEGANKGSGQPFFCVDEVCHASKEVCVEESVPRAIQYGERTSSDCVEMPTAWCFEDVLRPIKPEHAAKECLSSEKLCKEYLSDIDPMGRTCVKIETKDYAVFLKPAPVADKPGPADNGDVSFCGAVFPADTTELTCAEHVKDISALRHLKHLEDLTLHYFGEVEDLSPIAELTKLKKLSFEGNLVYDLKPLANLTMLEDLRFVNNLADDLSPIAGLTNLETLWVPDTVTNLAPVAGLTNLRSLTAGPKVTDLSPLAGLTKLERIRLDNADGIEDFSHLKKLKALKYLDLHGSNFADATVLAGLEELEDLDLSSTDIVDSSPLAKLPKVRRVQLEYSKVEDVSALVQRLKGGVYYTETPASEKRKSK